MRLEEINLRKQIGIEKNDCLATSVACLLRMPRRSVPHFVKQDRDFWSSLLRKWLHIRKLKLTLIDLDKYGWHYSEDKQTIENLLPPCIYIGPTEKNHHAIIGRYVLYKNKPCRYYDHDPAGTMQFFTGPPFQLLFIH